MNKGLALWALGLILAAPAWALDKSRDFVPPPADQIPNFRDDFRNVIIELADYAKKRSPTFQVLMRGGSELVVKGEAEVTWDELHDPGGSNFIKRLPLRAAFRPLIKRLDGIILDGMFCGPYRFEKPLADLLQERRDLDQELDRERKQGIHRPPTPIEMGPFSNDPKEELRKAAEIKQKQMRAELQRRELYAIDALRAEGRNVMSVDFCADRKELDAAYRAGQRDHVPTFAKVGTGPLDEAPRAHPYFENTIEVTSTANARNWLPILRSDRFGTKGKFIEAIADTNYDAVMVDVAHRSADLLVKSDVQRLKFKKLGARRLVLAVMPIGRAYDWRWYWQKGWDVGNPAFLFAHDEADGVYITDLASGEWRGLLGKYLAGIIDLGFDGVVFDDVGTYLWFEELMPIDG